LDTERSVAINPSSPLLTPASTFGRDFLIRAEVRFLVLREGALSAVIWAGAAVAALWLHQVGWGAALPWLFGVWFIAALPVMYLDLALILDMVGYVFTGRVSFFPTLVAFSKSTSAAERNELSGALVPPGFSPRSLTDSDEIRLAEIESHSIVRFVVGFLDASSPFSSLAMWALIVLARIPADRHVMLPPSTARAMKMAANRSVYDRTLHRFAA
jgi:hypothetical protein